MVRIALVGVLLLGITALFISNPFASDPARGLVENLEAMAQVVDTHASDCNAMADALTPVAARYEKASSALAKLDAKAQAAAREKYEKRIAAARKGLTKAVNCAMNRRVRDTLVNRL